MTLTLPRENWGEKLHRGYRYAKILERQRADAERTDNPTVGILTRAGEDVDALALFKRDMERRGLRPRSVQKRCDVARDLYRWMDGKGGILNATADDIEEWLDAKGDISSNYRAGCVSNVVAFYETMVRIGILPEDPSKTVIRPKVRQGLPRPISDDDLRVALKYAPPRERCFIALGAYAGLRCQEIAFLNVEDLLWSAGVLRVSTEAAKGGRERMIPIHDEVEKALRNYGIPKQGSMFRMSNGKRMTPERVSQLGSQFLASADIQATMHQLRHWFGTNVAKASIRTAQELLGHADLKSTATYTKVTVDDLRAAVTSLT